MLLLLLSSVLCVSGAVHRARRQSDPTLVSTWKLLYTIQKFELFILLMSQGSYLLQFLQKKWRTNMKDFEGCLYKFSSTWTSKKSNKKYWFLLEPTPPPKHHFRLQKNGYQFLNLWVLTILALFGILVMDQSLKRTEGGLCNH